MTNFLWHSAAPWGSASYSTLTARTVPNIVKAGHKVTLSSFYGLQGSPVPWSITDPVTDGPLGLVEVLPNIGGQYAAETMGLHYEHTESEALITVCDIWVFPPKHTHKMAFCPWFPIDFDPLSAGVAEAMEPAIYPMVYSKWGLRVIEEAGLKAHYVPCSAPTKRYKPGDKQAARQKLFSATPADFVVSIVAANEISPDDRKGFSEALQGFAKFLETHPNALLYIHTNWKGPIDIYEMVGKLGISERVNMPDEYRYKMGLLSEEYMANVYRASDVLLNTCRAEGFGLPLVEAQMCGTPIIAPDYSTTDELLFAGWKMKGQGDWGAGANSWRYRVFVDEVAGALEQAYRERNNVTLQQQAVNGAKCYDNDLIFDRYWKPALTDIERIISKGKKVYDFAKSVNLEPVQGRRREEPGLVPQAN